MYCLLNTHVDTSWLGQAQSELLFWLALFKLGSGQVIGAVTRKNELSSSIAEARCGSD
jgi:hypothetical protein